MNKTQKLQAVAAEYVENETHKMAKFAKALAENPHHAFSWGEQAVAAAAQGNVGRTVQVWVAKTQENQPAWTEEQVTECVVKELESELMRKVRWPERSTSQLSNMTEQYRTAAMAELLARVNG